MFFLQRIWFIFILSAVILVRTILDLGKYKEKNYDFGKPIWKEAAHIDSKCYKKVQNF